MPITAGSVSCPGENRHPHFGIVTKIQPSLYEFSIVIEPQRIHGFRAVDREVGNTIAFFAKNRGHLVLLRLGF